MYNTDVWGEGYTHKGERGAVPVSQCCFRRRGSEDAFLDELREKEKTGHVLSNYLNRLLSRATCCKLKPGSGRQGGGPCFASETSSSLCFAPLQKTRCQAQVPNRVKSLDFIDNHTQSQRRTGHTRHGAGIATRLEAQHSTNKQPWAMSYISCCRRHNRNTLTDTGPTG